jgi:membrane protein DedA with SNARE-associated domain
LLRRRGEPFGDIGWYSLGRFARPEWIDKIASRWESALKKLRPAGYCAQPYRADYLPGKIQRWFIDSNADCRGPQPRAQTPVAAAWLCGEMIKSVLIMLAGYFFGAAVSTVSGTVQTVIWSVTGVLAAAGLVWYKRRGHTHA